MWLFLLFICVSYLNAVLHGGEGTSPPSNNADEIIDRFLQENPKYANMDFKDGHLQALLKTSQNYPIRAPTPSTERIDIPSIERIDIPSTERIEGVGSTFNTFSNMFSNNFNNLFNNNFNQHLQPTPSIEDMFFQSNPNCAKITFENGHLPEMLKLIRKYPTSKLYNKYSTTQKIDQIGEDANADFAANTELHNICQEIENSGNPNLDCSKLNEIYQKDVKECLKRHDERKQISKSIFTSPDNPLNKKKMDPIPIPQFSSLQQPQAHPLITQLGGPAVMSHSPLSSLPIPGATSTMGFGSTQKKIDIKILPPPHELIYKNQIKLNESARMRELIKQKSNIGDNYNGINIASQQIKDLQQKQANNPLIPQSGRIQLTQTVPPVPHFFAQDSLNHRKKSNPQYARKPPLPVRIQNQPLPIRLGTNQQRIITQTVAQTQQQQTQHDKIPIPYHQQGGQIQPQPQHVDEQNQQIHQQHHVVRDNPLHPKNSLKQNQVQHDGTNIPYIPIDGHTQRHVGTNYTFSPSIGQIHQQQPQIVETNIPFYSTSGQKQKQMHQQHVETNNHFRTELHNEDDDIVEKRTLDEYEHMPENVAKKSKGKSVVQQHGGDFVGHHVQKLGTPNPQFRSISAEDFVHDEVFNKHYEDSNTNPLPYNFHQGIHGFNNEGEHGMAGSSSQMPHPTFNPNHGSLMQPGQHIKQSKQPHPPQHHLHSQGIESLTTPSSSDYTSSYDEDLSDLLDHFGDYSKQSSLDDIFDKNVLTSQHP